MAHIDYEVWIGYYQSLAEKHDIVPERTLDISCGTGRTIPYMKTWSGNLYCMDQSLPMIRKLYEYFPNFRSRSWVGDMSHLPTTLQFDLIMNIQDSVNYYTDPTRVQHHLENVYSHLTAEGSYLFDFSTVDNIRNNFIDMDEIYEADRYGYERVNTFMPRKRLNLTEFYIWEQDTEEEQVFLEKHLQKMYTIEEIDQCLQDSPFSAWFFYEDESFREATSEAERVHVVVKK